MATEKNVASSSEMKRNQRRSRFPRRTLMLAFALICVLALLVFLISFSATWSNIHQSLRYRVGQKPKTDLQDPKYARFDDVTMRDVNKQSATETDVDVRVFPEWPALTSDDEQCIRDRDYGIVEKLKESAEEHCQIPHSNNVSAASSYTYYNHRVKGTVWHNMQLDLRQSRVFKPIRHISQDGGNHDPRFVYMDPSAHCVCGKEQTKVNGAPRVWDQLLANDPSDGYAICENRNALLSRQEVGDADYMEPTPHANAIMVARRDDHNPFFQISAVLNAWIMLQAVEWSPQHTQVVFLDNGYSSPPDQLYKAVLSPNYPIVTGDHLAQRVSYFKSVMLAPFEMTGPMMAHLDDDEPCHDNQLISAFRSHALEVLGVKDRKPKEDSCIVTVITRRPYSGRKVQRVWRNEDEILEHMRRTYPSVATLDGKKVECEFRSAEFVGVDMKEQMQTIVESDFVIGMHGAGMVNVMWARPGVPVLEIFPHGKYRWGYRNLCQFIGCKWREFRGGEDIPTGRDSNSNDKHISKDEWDGMFKPMFEEMVERRRSGMEEAKQANEG